MNILMGGTGYSILAMVALPEDGSYRSATELAGSLGFPQPYLAKLFQSLAARGLLESFRGPQGGFRLARPAHRITLEEIVRALEGDDSISACPMGLTCRKDQEGPCVLHDSLGQQKAALEQTIQQTTLRDLQILDLHRKRKLKI